MDICRGLYGALLRATPQYHGLERTVLRSDFLQRRAIELPGVKWVSVPIRVADRALSTWLEKYEIVADADERAADARGMVS